MRSILNEKPARARGRRAAAHPGVQASSKRSDGSRRFRARVVVKRRQITGPWRATAEAAARDVERIRKAEHVVHRGSADTLGRALERVAQDARQRGLEEITVRNQYEAHARFLLSYWEPTAPLLALTAQEVETFVRAAIDHGRNPVTLRGKDLPLLDAAFRIAELESPIPKVRRRMRAVLKARALPVRAPTFEEIGEALHRIRTERFEHKLRSTIQETAFEARERHAALVELIASTGIRAGELARLEPADIDLERGTLSIRIAKDRSNPRVLPIPRAVLPAVRALLEDVPAGQRVFPSMGTLAARMARWAKRLNLPWLNARALRHAYATRLATSGASLAVLMRGLGHRDTRTASRYVDAARCDLAPLTEALGDALQAPKHAAAPEAPLA